MLREYSFRRMCREVVIFGAKYLKQPNSHGLETLNSELVFKSAFRKSILLTPPFCAF